MLKIKRIMGIITAVSSFMMILSSCSNKIIGIHSGSSLSEESSVEVSSLDSSVDVITDTSVSVNYPSNSLVSSESVVSSSSSSTLTFSSIEGYTSPNSLTIEGESINVDTSYNESFSTGSDNVTRVNGITFGYYRGASVSGATSLHPDHGSYLDTPYAGHEGAFYNISSIPGIDSIELTYVTGEGTRKATRLNPNVTFGYEEATCLDYTYSLPISFATENVVTINVTKSGFKYFSINTGDYYLNIKNIVINYGEGSSSYASYPAKSGENKVRCNPIRYQGTLVPGESQVSIPVAYTYDKTSDTYLASEFKTLTYYTYDYVKAGNVTPSVAAVTDPLLVSAYYTTFGTWPCNYFLNGTYPAKNNVQSLFGTDTRQCSEYNRTNGYATSVPWNFNGYYYELDIAIDTYSPSSRGVGRVVAWDKGWTAEGYDNSPVCVYTDDHYNTWLEYLNNGTWSNRFNGEGVVAGISYSAPKTVTLNGVPSINYPTVNSDDLSSSESEYIGEGEATSLVYDNPDTATFKKITSSTGLQEGFTYLIACEDFNYLGYHLLDNNYSTNLSSEKGFNGGEISASTDDYWPVRLEKGTKGWKMILTVYGEDKYICCSTKTNKNDPLTYDNENDEWKISFSYGNAIIKNINMQRYIRYVENNQTAFKTYKTEGSGSAIQLYCLCN